MLKKKEQKERVRSHEKRLAPGARNPTRRAKLLRWMERGAREVPRG